MKKITTIIFWVLMIYMLAIPVLAAQNATMSVSASKTTVSRGDTITVTVSASAVENCTSGGFMFSYDKNVFEYVSGSALSGVGGYTAGISTAAGNVAGYFMNGNTTVQGNIFQITLRVKDNAALGSYTISGVPNMTAADGTISCSADRISITVTCSHNYGNWTNIGSTNHETTCTICQTVLKEAHKWDNGTVIKKESCKEGGQTKYTCTACSATRTEVIAKLTSHTYNHACDTDCNVCGATRIITHSYKTVWSKDKNNHWYACSVCGDKKDPAAHTPGAEATETTAQTCTACGYMIKAALSHTHKYATAWATDAQGHWYACSGCEEKGSYAAHDFENVCDPNCSVCGYTREAAHTFEENYKSNGEEHWYECSDCGEKKDAAAHTPGAAATATTAQTCTVCNRRIVPALGIGETEPIETGTVETDITVPADNRDDDSKSNGSFFLWIVIAVAVVMIGGAVTFVVIKKKV